MSAIAGEHGLEPKVTEAYADLFYEHLDQTDESDLNFLIRIAKEHDALATVKGQTLLFTAKGEGKTASGLTMLPLPITSAKNQIRGSGFTTLIETEMPQSQVS